MALFTFNIHKQPYTVEADSVRELANLALEKHKEKGSTADYNVLYNQALKQARMAAKVRNRGKKPVTLSVSVAKKPGLSLKDFWEGGKATLKNVTGQIVDQATISSRGQLCLRCPLRKHANDCVGCGVAGKISQLSNNAKKLFGKAYKIPSKLESEGCGVCGCTFQVLLPARAEDLHTDTPEQRALRLEQAPFCWILKDE